MLHSEGWSKLSAFVEFLKKVKPLKPLEFNIKLCLEVPINKTYWSNREIFMKLIGEKKNELQLNQRKFI